MLYTFNSRKDVFFDVFLFDMIDWIYTYIYIYQQRIYYYLFIIGLSLELQWLTIQLNNHFLDEPNLYLYHIISYIISYHILYIIAKVKRKQIPTFKELLTNRKKNRLKVTRFGLSEWSQVFSIKKKKEKLCTLAIKKPVQKKPS